MTPTLTPTPRAAPSPRSPTRRRRDGCAGEAWQTDVVPAAEGHFPDTVGVSAAGFESLLTAAKGKKIILFLDYDGTLSPIVEDPDRAFMFEEVSNSSV